MGRTRLEFHQRLSEIEGVTDVYFRPPAKMMHYPCILYDYNNNYILPADNRAYLHMKRWEVTIIDEDPDSLLPDRLREAFQYCSSDRNYQADGLNHYVFTIIF